MTKKILLWAVALVCWGSAIAHAADRVLFEDDFEGGLSDKWQLVGLKAEDFRIREGGLELRVQPGKTDNDTSMLKVVLPFKSSGSVTASVDVTTALVKNHAFRPGQARRKRSPTLVGYNEG